MTIIYTSGTTGPQGRVEPHHANVAFSIESALKVPEISRAAEGTRALSYLPDAHLANRWLAHYVPVTVGMTVTTLADTKQLANHCCAGNRRCCWAFRWSGTSSRRASKRRWRLRRAQAKLINWALDVGSQRADALIAGRSDAPSSQSAACDRRQAGAQQAAGAGGAGSDAPRRLRGRSGLARCAQVLHQPRPADGRGLGMSRNRVSSARSRPWSTPRPGTVGKPLPGVRSESPTTANCS
ncbi:MAG: AMP-binding protein [Candidatus Microthrix sp.]|nr:AMP-binding protein [Candidatus Microthrix sp.]